MNQPIQFREPIYKRNQLPVNHGIEIINNIVYVTLSGIHVGGQDNPIVEDHSQDVFGLKRRFRVIDIFDDVENNKKYVFLKQTGSIDLRVQVSFQTYSAIKIALKIS